MMQKKLPKKLNGKQSVFVKYRTRYPTIEEFTNWNAVEHLDLSISIRFFFSRDLIDFILIWFDLIWFDWSTLGRWLLADSYFPTCYSSMRRCDFRVPLGSSRTARFASCSLLLPRTPITKSPDKRLDRRAVSFSRRVTANYLSVNW